MLSYPVAGQEEPGAQRFSFDLSQTFGANDNNRLNPVSVGTTYFSDTNLSFGINRQTGIQRFDFTLGGVFRALDDPVTGRDFRFRDPSMTLFYSREGVNSRLSLNASYQRPDLAFLDTLQQTDIDNQDLIANDGRREDYQLGVRFETGLSAPLGFEFGLRTSGRRYSDTTDPGLFDNHTETGSFGARLQFSPVTLGRVDLSEDRYSGKDLLGTNRTTRRFTFGVDHELSPITALNIRVGHSEVVETFDALPGVENLTRGPIGSLVLGREMPNGVIRAILGTKLSTVGRQTTFELERRFELPAGALEISLGATKGSGFSLLPIGKIDYTAELATGSFSASLSRAVNISSILSRAETTTRLAFGYKHQINTVSSLAFDLNYADISLTGGVGGTDSARGNFSATYTRDLTKDWDIKFGYKRRYNNSSTASSAKSNLLFVTLQRDFNLFR